MDQRSVSSIINSILILTKGGIMASKKLNVAVLMGGISSERDVSLRSGNEVVTALGKAGYNVLNVVVNDREIEELDRYDIDVAFIALHGLFGEDGGVQSLLENKRIPYIGSGVKASRLAMDKIEAKEVFNYYGLSTPDYIAVSKWKSNKYLKEKVELLGLPVIVKPAMNGSSVGVQKVDNIGDIKSGIDQAFEVGDKMLVEKYIEGREFTVGILNDSPLPIIEIKPGSCFYSYCSKYQDSRTKYLTEIDIDKQIYKNVQQLALRAHSVLGCRDFSRVDIMFGNDGKPYILEVNTIPGFTTRSLFPKAAKAANIEFVQLCDMLITMAVNRKSKMKECVEEFESLSI